MIFDCGRVGTLSKSNVPLVILFASKLGISDAIKSSPVVTSPLESKVILVLVAPVIAVLASTLLARLTPLSEITFPLVPLNTGIFVSPELAGPVTAPSILVCNISQSVFALSCPSLSITATIKSPISAVCPA